MKSIGAFGAAVLAIAVASPALAQTTTAPSGKGMKLTQAQCETVWNEALGATGAGPLTMEQAKPHVVDFSKADKDKDGKLTQTEWTDACNQGWVKTSASTGAGSGSSTAPKKPY